MMGWVWDRLLLNERLARWYYKHMMGVAMEMTPRPEGLPWFDRTRLRMQGTAAQGTSHTV